MRKRVILSASVLLLLATACQQQQQQQQMREKEQEETVAKTPPPLHLGAVHQVYPEQKFALLRIIGPMPGPGDTLITHPADGSSSRIGNLVISTGQPTRNNIIAADIRSGTVVKGDRVFRYRSVARFEEEKQEQENAPVESEATDDTAVEPSSYPASVSKPVSNMRNEDFPSPVLNSEPEESTSDTTSTAPVPQNETPAPPSAPVAPLAPATPAYLNDIPDDISQWD